MARIPIALALLAACGPKVPYQCSATVTGTGTSADGTYTCQIPPSGVYSPRTQNGGLSGFAISSSGEIFSFNLTMTGQPAATTYSDDSLPSGGAYSVSLSASGQSTFWEAATGSGAFALTVTDLNVPAPLPPLSEVWPHVTGTLTATLKPGQGNPATTNATVTMTF